MTRRRETKAKREERLYNALCLRVRDVCSGACGRQIAEEDEFLCAEELSRVVPALRAIFAKREPYESDPTSERELNEYLFMPHNLNHYETPASITEFLWDHDVRA